MGVGNGGVERGVFLGGEGVGVVGLLAFLLVEGKGERAQTRGSAFATTVAGAGPFLSASRFLSCRGMNALEGVGGTLSGFWMGGWMVACQTAPCLCARGAAAPRDSYLLGQDSIDSRTQELTPKRTQTYVLICVRTARKKGHNDERLTRTKKKEKKNLKCTNETTSTWAFPMFTLLVVGSIFAIHVPTYLYISPPFCPPPKA